MLVSLWYFIVDGKGILLWVSSGCLWADVGSYRGLTGHWKYIHELTVNLYQCAGCEKTFLKKPSALRHTRARCGGGLVTMVAINKCFVNPGRYSMRTAPAITSVAFPREQAAEARRRICEVAEQEQLAQMVDKLAPSITGMRLFQW